VPDEVRDVPGPADVVLVAPDADAGRDLVEDRVAAPGEQDERDAEGDEPRLWRLRHLGDVGDVAGDGAERRARIAVVVLGTMTVAVNGSVCGAHQ
jgi:hypothetical protein